MWCSSWYGSLGHSVVTTVVCLVLLVVTLPLWLIPPFFAIIPPLLWGWLTYRVMTYDALALHASPDERRAIVRRARWPLFGIGVISGLLGSLPTMLWAWSVWLCRCFRSSPRRPSGFTRLFSFFRHSGLRTIACMRSIACAQMLRFRRLR